MLVLHRYGATFVQIEVVLKVLLVFHEAMKISSSGSGSGSKSSNAGRGASQRPVISEDVQKRCLARISARVRFIEGSPSVRLVVASPFTRMIRTGATRHAKESTFT